MGGASGKIFELEPGPQRSSSAHEKRSPTDVVQDGDSLSRAEGTASARRKSAYGDRLLPPEMSTEHEEQKSSDVLDPGSQSNKDSRNQQLSAQSSKNDDAADVYKVKRPPNINTSQGEIIRPTEGTEEKLEEVQQNEDADDEADDDEDDSPDVSAGTRHENGQKRQVTAPTAPLVAPPHFSMMDQFRSAIGDSGLPSAEPHRLQMNFGPPPEDLIKKTVMDDEPVKTGAAIAFIKFNRLMGRERVEKLNPDNDKSKNTDNPNSSGNPQAAATCSDITAASTLNDYMLNAREAGRLVYCRFGEKYLQDMERRKNSNLSAINLPTSNLSSATYLINIKKLVDEHNIDGEKRDFNKMKTG